MVRVAGIAAAVVGFAVASIPSTAQARFLHGARLVPTSSAASSKTFTDPTGDNPAAAPDITTVRFSNDDSGRFEVRVTLANRPDLLDQDFVTVFVNTDQSTLTGCDPGDLGADYSFGVTGHTAPTADFFILMRCINSTGDRFTPQRTFTGEYDAASETAVFHFGCAEIGRPRALRLVIVASHGDPQNDPSSVVDDFAGLEPWLYDVVPSCGPDTTAPRVRALPSVGVRGKPAKLTYHVEDDSGYTKEMFAIYRGKRRLVHTSSISFEDADATKTYFVTWPVPKHVARKLRFCIFAVDEANNRSGTSCASLTIR